MNLLLDTNLIIIYSRDNAIAQKIDADYGIFDRKNNLAVSIVTIGELKSIIYKSKIGDRRKQAIENFLERVVKVNIDIEEIIDKYCEIDAFSQGQHKVKSSNFSARNMGKNDLWIAATASALDLKLVTTDKDFHHLNGEFLDLEFIDFESYKAT